MLKIHFNGVRPRAHTPLKSCCGLSYFWFLVFSSAWNPFSLLGWQISSLPSKTSSNVTSGVDPSLTRWYCFLCPQAQPHCSICLPAPFLFHPLASPGLCCIGWMNEEEGREGREKAWWDRKGNEGLTGENCGHSESGVPLPYISLHQGVDSKKLWWNIHIL